MQELGRYRIIAELGRGGMGIVYHAFDPKLRREVAIKTILYSQFGDPSRGDGALKDRLLREAAAAGTLSHPGIVSVYDVIEDSEATYIVMAYIKGTTLAQVIDTRNGPLPPDQVIELLREIGSAADHAHRKGVIHRDLKPSNIIIDEYGSAKIMDFGIAKVASCQTMTQPGLAIGTPEYMSPEQIMAKPVDGRSDQFSLAIVAYKMLTGRKPFYADSLSALTFKILQEEPARPSTVNRRLPSQLDTVLLRALAKLPSDRYDNCSALAEAVSVAILHSDTSADEARALGMVDQALRLGRESGKLNEAADLLEEALNNSPSLRKEYEYVLKLWRRGIVQ